VPPGTRTGAASPAPQIVHLWFPGSHPSHRTADAAVGAPGELRTDLPIPNGPGAPTEWRDVPTAVE
jgi:hypothetical protein